MSKSLNDVGNNKTVYCSNLVINPKTTSIKWKVGNYRSGIKLLDGGDVAVSTILKNSDGVIANEGFVVGEDTKTWYYCALIDSLINVGLAYKDQDLTSKDGINALELIDCKDNDNIRFELNKNGKLEILQERKHNSIIKTIKKYSHDLSKLQGEKLFPWVATTEKSQMSIKILYYTPYELTVGPDGEIFINGKNSKNDKEKNGLSIDENGSINLEGGIAYKCDNINSSETTYTMQLSDYAVTITNPSIKFVKLPKASTASCQFYSIIRNYPKQENEKWTDSALKVITDGNDLIEDTAECGIPYDSNIQLMSDGISKWRIV